MGHIYEGVAKTYEVKFINSESIEELIEDQAFLQSYDLAPPLPPPPLPSLSCLPMYHRSRLLTRRGAWGMWEEPIRTTARKPGPL
jgi:hypothetical protein